MPRSSVRFGIAGTILAAVVMVIAMATPAGATGVGFQYCYYNGAYACLNAWSGGPWVNVWTGGPNQCNGDFSVINNYATGDNEIEFSCGSGGWNGHCIGDAYNDPNNASTSLDACGNGGEGEGWGTNFQPGTAGCPAGQEWFYNTHWHRYLGPPDSWYNGVHFYLNKPQKWCFKYYNPA